MFLPTNPGNAPQHWIHNYILGFIQGDHCRKHHSQAPLSQGLSPFLSSTDWDFDFRGLVLYSSVRGG